MTTDQEQVPQSQSESGKTPHSPSMVYPKSPPRSIHWAWLNLWWPGLAQLIFGQKAKGIVLMVVAPVAIILTGAILLPFELSDESFAFWAPVLCGWFIIPLVLDAFRVGKALRSGTPVNKWAWFPLVAPSAKLDSAISEMPALSGTPAAKGDAAGKLILAIVLCAGFLLVVFGRIHIITGRYLDMPRIVLKESFGFSETFVNMDAILAMPQLAAISRYPLSVRVLQRERLIESNDEFQERARRDTEKELDRIMRSSY